jgi:hypothetical protein
VRYNKYVYLRVHVPFKKLPFKASCGVGIVVLDIVSPIEKNEAAG